MKINQYRLSPLAHVAIVGVGTGALGAGFFRALWHGGEPMRWDCVFADGDRNGELSRLSRPLLLASLPGLTAAGHPPDEGEPT